MLRNKFRKKSQLALMSIFPRSGARGLEWLECLKYYIVPRRESRFIFRLNAAEITDYSKKIVQIEVFEHYILYKKVNGRTGRGFQRLVCLESYNVQKWEIGFTLRLNNAKITHYIKKGSNKSCLELNFVQKSPRAQVSIFPTSGAGGL